MDLKNLFWDALKTLGICIFFGITLISIAGGAVYPPINIIAKPFVCPTAAMTYPTKPIQDLLALPTMG